MTTIRTGVLPEEIRIDSKHVLFVEGEEFDQSILETFFNEPTKIKVKSLGPSHDIKSVAQALYKHHPYYYFLIDNL
jgi:hypothetical protein